MNPPQANLNTVPTITTVDHHPKPKLFSVSLNKLLKDAVKTIVIANNKETDTVKDFNKVKKVNLTWDPGVSLRVYSGDRTPPKHLQIPKACTREPQVWAGVQESLTPWPKENFLDFNQKNITLKELGVGPGHNDVLFYHCVFRFRDMEGHRFIPDGNGNWFLVK